MPIRILEGLKVIELCQMVAGPYCSKLMADLGAEVVKVEPPLGGDPARRHGPFFQGRPHQEGSVLFLHLNTSKKSIQLDYRDPLGSEILRGLIGEADLFIEDTRPGTLERYGLEYEALRSLNPDLVMLSMTPFGQTGPYRDFKAYPLNTFNAGGEGYLTPIANGLTADGLLERPPTKQARYVGEYEAAVCAAIPALGAVFHSRAGGGGQHVDISKQEALIGLNFLEFHFYFTAGKIPDRVNRKMEIGGLMPCKDGYVEFCLHEEHQWRGLVRLLGEPAWAKEEWTRTSASRMQNADFINARLREWLPAYTRDEVMRFGQEAGTTVALYNTVPEAAESEQMRIRGYFQEVSHPVVGPHPYPTAAYPYDGEPPPLSGAPLLGQHDEEIYRGRGPSITRRW